MLSLFCILFDFDGDETVLFEMIITCTGLRLTCCDTLFVNESIWFSAVALEWLATSAFKKLYAILCLKKTLGFEWVFVFWRPKNFVIFAVSVVCFNRLRLWSNCAFWIDDNMHWALTDLFLWYSFCTRLLSLPRLLSTGLLLLLSKIDMQFCSSRKRLALTESLFFWRLKNLDFLYFAVFVPFLIGCDGDETVLFEMFITCTGFWLTCFMILFLYTRLWVFRRWLTCFCDTLFVQDYWVYLGCSQLTCYFCFQKVICNFVPRGNAWLWLTWIFLTLLSLFRVLIDWDCDEIALLELMITSTGLWLNCFMTKFVGIT